MEHFIYIWQTLKINQNRKLVGKTLTLTLTPKKNYIYVCTLDRNVTKKEKTRP